MRHTPMAVTQSQADLAIASAERCMMWTGSRVVGITEVSKDISSVLLYNVQTNQASRSHVRCPIGPMGRFLRSQDVYQ